MKRLAAFLIFLLAGAMVPAGMASNESAEPLTTLHITAGQPRSFEVEDAKIHWDGIFSYSRSEGWEAQFHVAFSRGTGFNHSVVVNAKGTTDAEKRFWWILVEVQTKDNPESKELGLLESWNNLVVKFIDPLSEKVIIDNDYNGKSYTLHVGDEIDISGDLPLENQEKTVLELESIKTGLFGSKAVLVIHHITASSGTVEIDSYQESQNSSNGEQDQANESPSTPQPFIDPTKVPTVMIIVGEHAAGADVAAGAKVGIAVQKWIDLIKDKGGDALIPELGGGFTAKLATLPVKNLNADAMLDTEVKDPDMIAPVVYTVGGPVANEYTKAILEKNADRLPVKFVKEGNQWYIEDNHGNKWGKGYGLILIIPAAENPANLQIRLSEGKIKMTDVVVAGTDRWGTYAACELLQGEFLKPLLGEKPSPDLNYILELQGRMLLLFGQDPLDAFDVNLEPSNPFKFQVIAVIVDKDGRIVKVVSG